MSNAHSSAPTTLVRGATDGSRPERFLLCAMKASITSLSTDSPGTRLSGTFCAGECISTLVAMKDGEAISFWLASPNTFHRGARPKLQLSANPSDVLAAAHKEVSIHG